MTLRLLMVACVLLCARARATTVIPPSFDELVAQSELIFRGHVIAVQSEWRGTGSRHWIATRVTFAVERVLRGTVGNELTLEFLGGNIGGKELEMIGWPRFVTGDRGVFFVEDRNGGACPLVRLRHGRYRVIRDEITHADIILRDDLQPLPDVSAVAQPLFESPTASGGKSGATLTLADFETRIAAQSSDHPLPAQAVR